MFIDATSQPASTVTNSDEKIRGWIRSCLQPDTETWSDLSCKPKGVCSLQLLQGSQFIVGRVINNTTDTDAASQRDPSTGENTGDKCYMVHQQNVSFQVDPAITKQLEQNASKNVSHKLLSISSPNTD